MHAPDAVALEESYVGADARIALSVGQARGAVLVAAVVRRHRVRRVRAEPASSRRVCGYGRADKGQVQRMVKAILGLDELPQPDHAADALAVAICHALAPPLLRIASAARPYRSRMISRLRGTVVARTPAGSSLDVGGVGYLVAATPRVDRARRRGGDRRDLPPRPRGRAPALRVRVRRRARALRAAARRLRHRAEGGARDRLGLAAGRAAPRDRPRRPGAVRGDPRHRPQDRAARRDGAEGQAGRPASRRFRRGGRCWPGTRSSSSAGRCVDAERALADVDESLPVEEQVRAALEAGGMSERVRRRPCSHDERRGGARALAPARRRSPTSSARSGSRSSSRSRSTRRRARGEALDHVLLAGPPGLGKTSLAQIIRRELDVGIRQVAGPGARAQGRHRRDPHRARAARRPLRRRDPPAEPRRSRRSSTRRSRTSGSTSSSARGRRRAR